MLRAVSDTVLALTWAAHSDPLKKAQLVVKKMAAYRTLGLVLERRMAYPATTVGALAVSMICRVLSLLER